MAWREAGSKQHHSVLSEERGPGPQLVGPDLPEQQDADSVKKCKAGYDGQREKPEPEEKEYLWGNRKMVSH